MKHLFIEQFLKYKLLRLLFSAIIGIFFIANTSAQGNASSSGTTESINYGVKFGTTISQFTNQQPHTNVKQGITAGGVVAYNFSDMLAIQLEVNYLQEGGQLLSIEHSWELSNDSWIDIKTDNRCVILHNLDIPLMLKYTLPLASAQVFINAGAAFGYNIYTSVKHETTVLTEIGSISTYTSEENMTSNIERFNVGMIAGLGFEIPVFNNNYILIDARYRYGLMPVYKGYSYRGIPQITGDLHNNTMYFTLGFGF